MASSSGAAFLALGLLCSCTRALVVGPATLPDGAVGRAYEAKVVVGNNRTPLMRGGLETGRLPPGLAIDPTENDDTVPIRGTPTAPGTYSFRLSLACYGTNFPGQTGARDYVIAIR